MKKLILTGIAVTCAVSVFAQGQVNFANRVAGSVITHVYGPSPTTPSQAFSGQGANDLPTGSTDWTGFTALLGAGYTAELWGAPTTAGVIQPETSLQAATPTTTFRTTATGAGWVNNTTATFANIPAGAPLATLQMRVWDNKGGTVNSWADAGTQGANRGASPLFNLADIGGGLVTPPNLTGLQSFSLVGTGTIIPEPSTFALAGLGAAALLIFRRRK